MNQKLILSLLVGSIACGLAADVAPEVPAAVEEQEVIATSRLAKLINAAKFVPVKAVGYVGETVFLGLRTCNTVARKGKDGYNYAAETHYGSKAHNSLVSAANNREIVGTASSIALAIAGYKFSKTAKYANLKGKANRKVAAVKHWATAK